MRRFLLAVFALLVAASASAQYIPTAETNVIESRGAKIFCYGETLTKDQAAALFSDFGGLDRGDEYLSNRKGYRTGVGLSVGGASMVAVGLPASYVATAVALAYGLSTIGGGEVPVGAEIALYGTYGMTIAGAAMMLAGIPTAAVYQHRIKKMTKEYNALGQHEKPVLTFGPASSGIGIAMTF